MRYGGDVATNRRPGKNLDDLLPELMTLLGAFKHIAENHFLFTMIVVFVFCV